ncbi:MAG TPA: hypothetical protein PLM53_01030 [Spirochaetota bacterium]|nr:hypothetical protein [Spirochaetota bacterium]HPC39394.1 hypothetical protein [Spirochaetota bacterium]HPL16881.1 hypothetical protein [Spirochaetota bacterium]HQF06731.1 hypothetical protein [Spirochaetota bacterium]HQH95650.1 hypothetical protein [Spirochaetota bacterium]
MYLIKTCPTCKTRLRFPIDKGTIKVKCNCGYSFIANPDNTDIYKDASFDLSHTTGSLKKMTPLRSAISRIQFDQIIPNLINTFLDLKYKIQNFRLLPDAEKKKIMVVLLLACAGVIGVIVTIYFLTHRSGTGGNIII